LEISYEREYGVYITFLCEGYINFKKDLDSKRLFYAHLNEDTLERVRKCLQQAITRDQPVDLFIKITQNSGCSKFHLVLDADFSGKHSRYL